jgi:hypothetical protein
LKRAIRGGRQPFVATPEEAEARWRAATDEVAAAPRDPDVLTRAAQLAESLGRRAEAFLYYRRAIEADPARTFVVPYLRRVACSPEEKAEVEKLSARPASYRASLQDVFAYPLRGNGAGILAVGAVFFALILEFVGNPIGDLTSNVLNFNIMTVLAAVAFFCAVAYFGAFFVDVLRDSATGSDDLPEWPDPSRGGFFLDSSRITSGFLVAYLPLWIGFAVSLVKALSHAPPFDWIGGRAAFGWLAGAALLLGSLYLPMAVLANAIVSPLACLNPFFVARATVAAPRDYLVCAGACLAVVGATAGLRVFLAPLLPGLVAGPATTLILFYGLAVTFRTLGLFYRANRGRLGWLTV